MGSSEQPEEGAQAKAFRLARLLLASDDSWGTIAEAQEKRGVLAGRGERERERGRNAETSSDVKQGC